MKRMRKYQEGGMVDEELEKYGVTPRQSYGTSGRFDLPGSLKGRSVDVSPDGTSAGVKPPYPQSSGLIKQNESLVKRAAKALIPGGMGATAGVAAAAEAKRKKEQEQSEGTSGGFPPRKKRQGYKSGGYVKAADGCAQRGKTKGTMVVMK